MIAAGEVAMGLQHAMNNPLTALLAEAQLLELEELPPEQRASVGRMIELSRRVIALVRSLDVIVPARRSS
jgi:signal transduction histidine kinase